MRLPAYLNAVRSYDIEGLVSILATTDATYLPRRMNRFVELRRQWYPNRGVPWCPWMVEPEDYECHRAVHRALRRLERDRLVERRRSRRGPYCTVGVALTNIGEAAARALLGHSDLEFASSAYDELCYKSPPGSGKWTGFCDGNDLLPALSRGLVESTIVFSTKWARHFVKYRTTHRCDPDAELAVPELKLPRMNSCALGFLDWRDSAERSWMKYCLTNNRFPWCAPMTRMSSIVHRQLQRERDVRRKTAA